MPTFFQINDDGEYVEVEVPDPNEVRQQFEKDLKAERAQAKKDAEDAARWRTEAKDRSLRDSLGSFGDDAIERWKDSRTFGDAEPTPELVEQFAQKFGYAQAAAPAEPEVAAPQAVTGYVPMATGNATTVQQQMSEQEFRVLFKTNRAAADKAISDGRVRWDTQQTAELVARGLSNR